LLSGKLRFEGRLSVRYVLSGLLIVLRIALYRFLKGRQCLLILFLRQINAADVVVGRGLVACLLKGIQRLVIAAELAEDKPHIIVYLNVSPVQLLSRDEGLEGFLVLSSLLCMPLAFIASPLFLSSLGICFYIPTFQLFKGIGTDDGGGAYFGTAFVHSDDFSPALQEDGAIGIHVLHDDVELYGLPGGKGSVRLEEYPRAAEVPRYASG